ncbi:MAG: dihydroorotase, partial [Thermoleophilia bacterium]|nr:dihydroorotase [Thermoleophilia bacterium]
EYREDISTGTRAAAAGGYVVVAAMANTSPVIDNGPLLSWVLDEADKEAHVRVAQVGAISKGLQGEELAEIREMVAAGAAGFSDDGRPVSDAELLLQALRYVGGTGRPLLLHLENLSLSRDGVMHEGRWSARLGLRGIPSVCESASLARDLEVIRYVAEEASRRGLAAGRAGGEASAAGRMGSEGSSADYAVAKGLPWVHFQHLSAAESVRLLRQAKTEGLPVSAEVTPAHLLYSDERLAGFDPNLKVNPPLRGEEDREALITALAEGTIDCIGTDHAPHAPQEKEVPLEQANSGSIGLETAFAAAYSALVATGRLSLERLVTALSSGPARVLGVAPPRLAEGAPADFCVANLEEKWIVTPDTLCSKSRNCAFLGEEFTGRVCMTVVDGTRRYVRGRGEE